LLENLGRGVLHPVQSKDQRSLVVAGDAVSELMAIAAQDWVGVVLMMQERVVTNNLKP